MSVGLILNLLNELNKSILCEPLATSVITCNIVFIAWLYYTPAVSSFIHIFSGIIQRQVSLSLEGPKMALADRIDCRK